MRYSIPGAGATADIKHAAGEIDVLIKAPDPFVTPISAKEISSMIIRLNLPIIRDLIAMDPILGYKPA